MAESSVVNAVVLSVAASPTQLYSVILYTPPYKSPKLLLNFETNSAPVFHVDKICFAILICSYSF